MKTEQEIQEEIRKTTGRVEALEHLIAEAELGIKMHRKEMDVVSARLRGLQWCVEKSQIEIDPLNPPIKPQVDAPSTKPIGRSLYKKQPQEIKCPCGHMFGVDLDSSVDCDGCKIWEDCQNKNDELSENKMKKKEV